MAAEYHPPEFDPELQAELFERIQYKSPNTSPDAARILSTGITWYVGYLCSAFEEGFVREIDALVGNEDYRLRVFMSRDNQRTI